MLSNEELANIFIQTMQAHANPRSYDWAMYSVGIGGLIASVIVAYFAYQLNEKQTNMLEQQNKIALFEKRYELYVRWSQLYYASQYLVTYINEYNKKYTYDTKGVNKEFFCKSVSILFPNSKMNTDITAYEDRLHRDICRNVGFQYHEEPPKDYILFFDFGAHNQIDPHEFGFGPYTKILHDFNEMIYSLKMIPKLFSLKEEDIIGKIFKKIKQIQKGLNSEENTDSSLQDLFLELAHLIENSKIKEEMFEQINVLEEKG